MNDKITYLPFASMAKKENNAPQKDAIAQLREQLNLPQSQSLDDAIKDFYALNKTLLINLSEEEDFTYLNAACARLFETLQAHKEDYFNNEQDIPAHIYTSILIQHNLLLKENHPHQIAADYQLSVPSEEVEKANLEAGEVFGVFASHIEYAPKETQFLFLCLVDHLTQHYNDQLSHADWIMSAHQFETEDQTDDNIEENIHTIADNIVHFPDADQDASDDKLDLLDDQYDYDDGDTLVQAQIHIAEIKKQFLCTLEPIASNLTNRTYLEAQCIMLIQALEKKLDLKQPQNLAQINTTAQPVPKHQNEYLDIGPDEDHEHIFYRNPEL